MNRRTLLVALLLVPGSVLGCERPRHGPTAEVRSRLGREFPGWRFARLNAFNREQLGPEQHAAWVRGDFDGDSHPDWAVQIIHPAERINSQSVIVFLRRGDGYVLHTVQSVGENEGTYLGRRPPGWDRDVVEDTAVVSRSDFLDILYGQEASVAFIYRDGSFVSYTTGD